MIKNSQPFVEKCLKTAGRGYFLTHTVDKFHANNCPDTSRMTNISQCSVKRAFIVMNGSTEWRLVQF